MNRARPDKVGEEAVRQRTLADSKTLADSEAVGRNPEGARPAVPRLEIPDHELVARISSGSYGEVWLARNVMGTYRAVKIVARASFEHARPFEREFNGIKRFEPLSRSHDGFIDILQVGRTEDCFYYVMELADDQVAGQQIDPEHYVPKSLRSELRAHRRLPFEKCVELGISLTQALGHLHRHGLVHRDIKPSNIIFVNGILKLADIGLVAEQSEARSFVGTEGFIPPEGPGTPQADIYSLGKVLYEIATGKDRNEFPALPTLLGEEPMDAHLLELNSVCLKACQVDIKLRYQTTEAMREDLLLLQTGKSVKRAQATERRLAWLTRASAVVGVIAILALAGIYHTHRQARRDARLRAAAYVANGDYLVNDGDLAGAVDSYVKALEVEPEPADAARHRFRIGATFHLMPKVVQLLPHGDAVNDVAFSSDGRWVASASADKTACVWDSGTGELIFPPLLHSNPVQTAIFSADRQRLLTLAGMASASEESTSGAVEVKLWDLQTGQLITAAHHPDVVTCARFCRDAMFFATGCADGRVRVWDGRRGALLRELPHPAEVLALSLSRDGKHLVSSADDSRLRLWDLANGTCLFSNIVSGAGATVAINPDGRTYCGTSISSGVTLYSMENGQVIRTFGGATAGLEGLLSFSPDGRRLLFGASDQRIKFLDVDSGHEFISLGDASARFRQGRRLGAAFSPDGRNVLTWMQDGTARLWSAAHGNQVGPPLRHTGPITTAAFSPESRRVVTAGTDGFAKVWDLASDASLDFQRAHFVAVQTADWSPDGRQIAMTSGDALVRVWELANPQLRGQRIVHEPGPGWAPCSQWSRDWRRVVTVNCSGSIRVWDGSSLRPLTPFIRVLTNGFVVAAISPDGQRVAVSGALPEVRIFDAGTGDPKLAWPHRQSGRILQVGFTSKGNWLFTKGEDNTARLWNPLSGAPVGQPLRHEGALRSVCSSHDESQLTTACDDGTVWVWEVPNGRLRLGPLRHRDRAWTASFSPDDQRLLTASEDGTACVWDTQNGQLHRVLEHGAPVTHAAFSRDARYIAAATTRGARVWDGMTGEPLSPWLPPFQGSVAPAEVKFSPVDDRLAICDPANGLTVRMLRADDRPLELLQAQVLVVGGAGGRLASSNLAKAWGALRKSCPGSVSVSPGQALLWHRTMAAYCCETGDAYGLEAHTRPLLAAFPTESLFRRWAAAALLNQGRASEAIALDPELVPPRSPRTDPSLLDLTAFFTDRLTDDTDRSMDEPGSYFATVGALDFTPGTQTLAGVPFDVRGSITSRARSIPVNRRVSRFHMLQFAYFETTERTVIGRYVLTYGDGQEREFPIRYGIDLRNFWGPSIADGGGDPAAEASEATVAWRGAERHARTKGASIRFFKRTYENPRPEVPVASISFEPTWTTPCHPALLAITVE